MRRLQGEPQAAAAAATVPDLRHFIRSGDAIRAGNPQPLCQGDRGWIASMARKQGVRALIISNEVVGIGGGGKNKGEGRWKSRLMKFTVR